MNVSPTELTTTHTSLEFAGAPHGWGLIVAIALWGVLLATVTWLYRREGRVGTNVTLRRVLTVLRCGLFTLLAIVALRPIQATYLERTSVGRLPILVDVSASMDVRDAVGGATRAARTAAMLSPEDGAWLRALGQKNTPLLYDFAASAVRRGVADAPGPPLSGHTDLGAALRTALRDIGGSAPLAGCVVITDGLINRGMTPTEIGELARQAGVSLHIIGIGAPREPLNLKLTSLAAPSAVALGDPFELSAAVVLTGQAEAEVMVELIAAAGPGDAAAARMSAQSIRVGADRSATVTFPIDASEAGERRYQLRVAELPGEAYGGDNSLTAAVRVLDRKLRVLIVAGKPSYDYRYVTRLLERDATVDVSCWLQSADAAAARDGDVLLDALPRTPATLFAYDVVLLLDPDPAALDADWAALLARFVNDMAGGLLYEAGAHFTTHLTRTEALTELQSLLPAVLAPEADPRLTHAGAFRTNLTKLTPPETAATPPIVMFDATAATNDAIWSALPGVGWTMPVARLKPLATALLATNDAERDVVFAVQPVGAGVCAFLGTEGAWRWRSAGEAYFNHFWIQTVRYLARGRGVDADSRGEIVLEREVIEVGQRLHIEARLLDDRFAPWPAESVPAALEFADAPTRTLTLRALRGRAGWFAGDVLLASPGPGRLRVAWGGSDAGAHQHMLETAFRVQSPTVEMRRLACPEPTLRALAEATGGGYYPLARADELVASIASATRTRTEPGPRRDLWDNGWCLGAFAGLLALEWTLRRRSHLL